MVRQGVGQGLGGCKYSSSSGMVYTVQTHVAFTFNYQMTFIMVSNLE